MAFREEQKKRYLDLFLSSFNQLPPCILLKRMSIFRGMTSWLHLIENRISVLKLLVARVVPIIFCKKCTRNGVPHSLLIILISVKCCYHFVKELVERIWWKISACSLWWSFFQISWPFLLIMRYSQGKNDLDYSWELPRVNGPSAS